MKRCISRIAIATGKIDIVKNLRLYPLVLSWFKRLRGTFTARLLQGALVFALLHSGFFSQMVAAQDRTEARNETSISIQLDFGLESPKREQLIAQLKAQLTSQLKRRLNLGAEDLANLDPQEVEKATIKTMESLGYLSAQVSATTQSGSLQIAVQPGPQLKVQSLSLNVVAPNEQERQRLSSLLLDPITQPSLLAAGQPFSAIAWEKFKADSLAKLQQRLYPSAQILDSQAELDEASASATLKLTLKTGPLMRIGDVKVNGLARYRLNRVIDLVAIAPDSAFDAAALAKAQLALLDTRWFSSVTITPSIDASAAGTTSDKINLDVNVIERPSQRLTLGLGFSSDVGPRARFAFEDTSIGPRGWSANTNLILNRKEPSLELGVKTQVDARGISFGSNLKFQHKDINGESLEQTQLSAFRTQKFYKFDSVYSLTWQRERQLIGAGNVERSRALVPGWSWNYRDLDDSINPRKGYTFGIQVSAATRNLASSTDFQRLYLRGSWLQPLGKSSDIPVLALRGEFGAVGATRLSDVPSDNLFRSGGSQTLRGYGYQDIGQTVTTTNGGQTSTSIIGGSRLATASAEIRVPLSRLSNSVSSQWEWSLFYDVGDASNRIKANDLSQSFGTGLRFKSPVGPVGLDVAYGDRTKRWRAHFTVGFNF